MGDDPTRPSYQPSQIGLVVPLDNRPPTPVQLDQVALDQELHKKAQAAADRRFREQNRKHMTSVSVDHNGRVWVTTDDGRLWVCGPDFADNWREVNGP